ncbi:MAG TPA: protein-L-isoaspartate O-methyltransferase [Gammaproteobacteria bacterium]|nr:protein-L-isoaspartate O-methyltransferase [Gammaproteobacteria bacterium]
MLAPDPDKARFNMVEQQIRPCEIIDERVLAAFKAIPREHFVDESQRPLAFADTQLPLPNGDVMMKPLQEGFMLQALEVKPGERVLEVGTGSGFVTACLAHLGGRVTSYEIDPEQSARAAERLQALGIDAELVVGDIFEADLPEGSFDVIAVTGSLPCPSEKLERLLAPGGRMFLVKGEPPVMCATLVTRAEEGDALLRKGLCETLLPPLKNAPQPDHFQF